MVLHLHESSSAQRVLHTSMRAETSLAPCASLSSRLIHCGRMVFAVQASLKLRTVLLRLLSLGFARAAGQLRYYTFCNCP
eukprot:1723399-Pleurochrysis_carterae.AAC.1